MQLFQRCYYNIMPVFFFLLVYCVINKQSCGTETMIGKKFHSRSQPCPVVVLPSIPPRPLIGSLFL